MGWLYKKHMLNVPALVIVTAVWLVSSTFIACGSSDSPMPTQGSLLASTATPSLSIEPAVLLKETGLIMAELDSFQFLLTHQRGGTPLFAGIMMEEAKAEVVKPDAVKLTITGSSGAFFVELNVIAVGGVTYMTNPITNQWEVVPIEVSPIGIFDPGEGIRDIMLDIKNPVLAGKSDEPYYLIQGTVGAETLQPILGVVTQGSNIEVNLKIEKVSRRLFEAVIKGQITPGEQEGIIRVIEISKFNERFKIEAPN